METVKNLRIIEEDHKWLMMQRALTGVPANQQIHNFIEKEKANDKQPEKTPVLPPVSK
jgi:hypothetical protein